MYILIKYFVNISFQEKKKVQWKRTKERKKTGRARNGKLKVW